MKRKPTAFSGTHRHPVEVLHNQALNDMKGRAPMPKEVKTLFWRTKDWSLAMKKEIAASRSRGRVRAFWGVPGYVWRMRYEMLARNLRLHHLDCVDWEYAYARFLFFLIRAEIEGPKVLEQAENWWQAIRRCRKFARFNRAEYHEAVRVCKPLVARMRLAMNQENPNG